MLIDYDAYKALGGIEAVLDCMAAGVTPKEAGLARIRTILDALYAKAGFAPPSQTATQIAHEAKR